MDLIDRHQQMWREHRARQAAQHRPPPVSSSTPVRRNTKAAAGVPDGTSTDKLIRVKLEADLHRLSLQPSREARTRLQAELLKQPVYAEHIARAQAGDGRGEDPILVRCMIWAFNVRDMQLAMQLADIAHQRGLAMPDEFKASVETFLCREIAYWSLAEQKEGRSPQPYLDQVWEKSRHWQKPDQVEARLLKAKGQDIQANDPAAALKLYQQAHRLDDGAGVSHQIKRLQKQLLE